MSKIHSRSLVGWDWGLIYPTYIQKNTMNLFSSFHLSANLLSLKPPSQKPSPFSFWLQTRGMEKLKWKRQHLESCVLEKHRKWRYECMCQNIIYTIPPSLESSLSRRWQVTMVKSSDTVTSVIAPRCSLPVIVSRTKERISGRQQRSFLFLFHESSGGVAIHGFWAWWQEAKEGWVGTKKKRSISVLLILWPKSPGRVSQGVPAKC